MKRTLTTGALLALGATSAGAVGLDRSNQDITVIFEEGTYGEFSFATTSPDLSGVDDPAGTGDYDDVGDDYSQLSFGYKQQINDKVSFALIGDQPFGAAISYEGDPATTALGGTMADLDSAALTALGRYQITDRFSVHGGLRRETLEGDVTLSGQAYGPLNGYRVELDRDSASGYVLGAAYEIPDIALRVALTYNSSITHEFDSHESLGGVPISAFPPGAVPPGIDGEGTTEVETPEAWNLDFQSGVAEDTLVFGSIRHATYSQTKVSPEFFEAVGGGSLTDINDGTSYNIGVGRQITPNFAASISVGYTPEDDDDLVSPLAPTNGQKSVQIGGTYTMDRTTISAGIRYTKLGDAHPETGTPDVQRATFEDNSAVSIGMSVGYQF